MQNLAFFITVIGNAVEIQHERVEDYFFTERNLHIPMHWWRLANPPESSADSLSINGGTAAAPRRTYGC